METKIRSKYLKQFISEIQYKNRNPRDLKTLELLDDLSTNPERVLTPGEKIFRCRIINNTSEVNKGKGFFGYGPQESFVPPPEKTRDMRASYRYIPYLYCANDPYTALVEVRPRLGAQVSVATIQVNGVIRLLDFTMQSVPSKMTEAKKNLFSDLSILYSKPVTSDDDVLDYIPTQYIAEYAKYLGYDGISFRSSLTPELENQDPINHPEWDRCNIVVFNYDKCAAIKSNVIEIAENSIGCQQIDDDLEKLNIRSVAEELLVRI